MPMRVGVGMGTLQKTQVIRMGAHGLPANRNSPRARQISQQNHLPTNELIATIEMLLSLLLRFISSAITHYKL
jgi:hypothetical protein